MILEDVKKLNLPKTPGCYQFLNKAGKIIYIGKAANLASRVCSYWQKSTDHTPAKYAMLKETEKIKWIETDSEIEALLLESNLIKKYQPQFNVVLRDDKRFVYVKISLDDEIPGVFITRQIDKSGRYFGPFVSTQAVRETLKTIRKIWPYCNARKPQKKPCFYYQINRCVGICGGLVSKKEYLKKVIKPIILFFEGKKKKIIKNYELRINNLKKALKRVSSASEDYEGLIKEIESLNFLVKNLEHVLAHANVLGLSDKYATDVIELAKVLGLPRAPERIEGYDISNIFGHVAVGSMVVFNEGEPNKSQYRKFKIRVGQGEANDIRMLKEVLERRFARSWPLPDLIIVDGGKAQINAVTQVLKKFKLDIPAVAISKGEGLRSAIAPDKLFFPGEKKSLDLPLASPALHLIKRVRDEAHRFAISYHRLLRRKKLFE